MNADSDSGKPLPLPSPGGRGSEVRTLIYDPKNPWRGGEERRKKRIRARTCLSEASLCVTPLFLSTAVPAAKRRDDEQGRLSFGNFSLAKQRKVTRCRATPGNLSKETATN